jgi:ankyrin repeat protein
MSMQNRVLTGWVVMGLMTMGNLVSAAVDVSLVEAVELGDREAVRSLLAGHADVNAQEADGATALAWAVHRDDLETATLLLEAGADANAANDYGVTPLTLACANGNLPMVERLLDAEADPDKAQWTGETPLMTCASTGVAAAVSALVASGADLEAKESKKGQTSLMWAVAEKHPAVVKVLVDAGADVHARSRILPRPEPYVIKSTNLYGASYGPSVYFPKTSGGFTPLLFAARTGDVGSARVLLAAGADPNEATEEAMRI